MDLAAVRDQLVKIIAADLPESISVHRSAFDGIPALPTVIIGMPSWEDDTTANYCAPHTMWPIAVVVARPGSDDAGTVEQLDTLWPVVFEAIRDASRADPTLAGVCRQSVTNRAQFGQFAIQGQTYPAQLITVDLYG